jgi:putative endonuclease
MEEISFLFFISKFMYYVYIIYSESADRYYIGYCSELASRLEKHNAGATLSTKPYRPWKLVYSEPFENKSDAIKREKALKKMKNRKYLETLIDKG